MSIQFLFASVLMFSPGMLWFDGEKSVTKAILCFFWVGQDGHINILKVLSWESSGNMFKSGVSEGASGAEFAQIWEAQNHYLWFISASKAHKNIIFGYKPTFVHFEQIQWEQFQICILDDHLGIQDGCHGTSVYFNSFMKCVLSSVGRPFKTSQICLKVQEY